MYQLTQMQLNNNKVSNFHQSKGMNALCDVSCIFKSFVQMKKINRDNAFTTAILKYYPQGKFIFEGDLFSFGNFDEIGIILWSEQNLRYEITHFSKAGQEGNGENFRIRNELKYAKYLGNYFKNPEILEDFIGYKIDINEL